MKKIEVVCDGCMKICETGIGINLHILYGLFGCHLCKVYMGPVLTAMRSVGVIFSDKVEELLGKPDELKFSLVD